MKPFKLLPEVSHGLLKAINFKFLELVAWKEEWRTAFRNNFSFLYLFTEVSKIISLNSEVFALLGCHAVCVGSCLPTFQDSLSVPFQVSKCWEWVQASLYRRWCRQWLVFRECECTSQGGSWGKIREEGGETSGLHRKMWRGPERVGRKKHGVGESIKNNGGGERTVHSGIRCQCVTLR